MSTLDRRKIESLGWIISMIICLCGTLLAVFKNGAGADFNVFYHAWNLVLTQHGSEIYTNSPDRFLYAPGFAWFFSFLALLPFKASLVFWSALKFVAIVFSIKILKNLFKESPKQTTFFFCTFACLWVIRPLIIDFQYGQINSFILFFTLLACTSYFQKTKNSYDFFIWFLFSIFSLSKLYTLPLLLMPFFISSTKKYAKFGILVGIFCILLLPLISYDLESTTRLYQGWLENLKGKGIPYDSHNQSFAALLIRYFSGRELEIHALGPSYRKFGFTLFSTSQIQYLALIWSLSFISFFFYVLKFGIKKISHTPWICAIIGLCFLPSHLIWKPYYIFSMPLFCYCFEHVVKSFKKKNYAPTALFIICFSIMNLTSFDIIGVEPSVHIEIASNFLWAHLVLLSWTLWIAHKESAKTNPTTAATITSE